ncbi:MAG: cache domain-containing protein, partial [Verrucomicrobia bacterium]|nr:cache domain-containing protein [Verrucomicrobiota bacterium]
MARPDPLRLRPVSERADRDRFERFNIVVAILLAGWVPSILMLVVAYTILPYTLESKILRDRQTFTQLIAHLVGDDFARTANIIEYYETQPEIPHLLASPDPASGAEQWLNAHFYSHPRIDGMFIANAQGKLVASVPFISPENSDEFFPADSREKAAGPSVYVSSVHVRPSDNRLIADLMGAVHAPDGNLVGYLGISVVMDRVGRRLSSIKFADQSVCQVFDQNGAPLFPNGLSSDDQTPFPNIPAQRIRENQNGTFEEKGNLYASSAVENTGWLAVIAQPKAAAYKPVKDLLAKITFPAVWLIILTAIGAWLAGKFTRRQTEAARRIEREVVFNEKILANMPSGIALVDPDSRNFLQAN